MWHEGIYSWALQGKGQEMGSAALWQTELTQLILNQEKYRYKQLTIQVLLDRYRSPGML